MLAMLCYVQLTEACGARPSRKRGRPEAQAGVILRVSVFLFVRSAGYRRRKRVSPRVFGACPRGFRDLCFVFGACPRDFREGPSGKRRARPPGRVPEIPPETPQEAPPDAPPEPAPVGISETQGVTSGSPRRFAPGGPKRGGKKTGFPGFSGNREDRRVPVARLPRKYGEVPNDEGSGLLAPPPGTPPGAFFKAKTRFQQKVTKFDENEHFQTTPRPGGAQRFFGVPFWPLGTPLSPRSRVVVRGIAGKGKNGTPREGPKRAPGARF